jgi:DnaK suppressor protein
MPVSGPTRTGKSAGENGIEEKGIGHFRRILIEELNLLLVKAGETVSSMSDDYREELSDPTDRASLESNRNFTLRIRDRERKLIKKLTDALARIDNGTFGICESCGRPISQKRLIARPVATHCIECKTEEEKAEK